MGPTLDQVAVHAAESFCPQWPTHGTLTRHPMVDRVETMILFDYDKICSKELSQVDSLALASLKVHVRMYKLFEAMPKLDSRCGFYKIPEELSEWKNLAIHIIELRKGKSMNYPGMDVDRKLGHLKMKWVNV